MQTMFISPTGRKKEPESDLFSHVGLPDSQASPSSEEIRTGTPRRLQEFFERTADTRPDNLALVCGATRLPYAALEARANQLARRLARLGVRRGDRVGLLLERSVHTYVALLAVLKCGAAFVPLDPTFPAERVAFIADDANLRRLLTTSDLAGAAGGVSCPVTTLDTETTAAALESVARIELPAADDDLCYIIYTSGTTGRPKGVAVTHASICNFLAACTPVYAVTDEDRVYQGMTLAFDFSIEEVWPTFAAGAALVAGPNDHRRLGSGLTDFLIEQEITVLACVPTLLATIERDVPSLRTLLVGGEACPADLVKRWSRAGRRMLNTYGPTETSVTATWAELWPDKPVTIGRPMPTYTVHILDDNLRPVPRGEAGEICIGGPSVAVGYVNRPDLTAEKFVADPFSDAPGARLYRTGDLGRLAEDDEIEYLGRIDTQVKIRGYRIELSEIEAILLEDAAVANAIVALVTGEGGVDELAAYVVPRNGSDFGELRSRLHAKLRLQLPAYMVPAYIEALDAIPMLPSHKADRPRLPRPSGPRLGAGGDDAKGSPPQTPLERRIADAWGRVFGHEIRSAEADFFLDLGGHSLFAAMAVSDLRHAADLHHLGIADLYAHPTIRTLARHVETLAPRNETAQAGGVAPREVPLAPLRHSSARVWLCGAAQFGLSYLLAICLAAPLAYLPGLGFHPLVALALAGCLLPPAALLLPLAAKWLLVGRFRAGRYPLWGWYFCRWWLARKVMALSPLGQLAGSPFLAPYLRLLGARVGAGCHLGSARLQLPDLLEIEDGASIGYGAAVEPYVVKDGWLIMEPIRIGKNAYVGVNSVVSPGATVGDGACVLEQSLVARGQSVPANETWAGSPSRRVEADTTLSKMAAAPAPERWSPGLLAGFVVAFLFVETLPLLMAGPSLLFLAAVSGGDMVRILWAGPAAGVIFVLSACLVLAASKRAVMPRTPTGIFPLRSWFGLRKWLADNLMNTSLAVTNSLYATLYTAPWLRLLGAKVGRRTEVSTVSHVDPDLLVVGAESFVADLAVVGAARHHRGCVALGVTEIGVRTFVGNAALVPSDTRLADNSLIGVQSVPPAHPIENGTSWLGSPAIFLPRRQASDKFDESVTFRPPPRLVACRLAIEFFRVTLPAMLFSTFGLLGTLFAELLSQVVSTLTLALLLPAVYLASALLGYLMVVALKWLVVGRYRPRVAPMWSHFVWRSELITALYESSAVPALLNVFTGTPFLAPLLRLLGVKMGRRAFVETTYMTEFDLVEVGDDAAIGATTSLQTHLFEDRVMKMSTVKVGAGCAVGPRAVVLYDSELEPGAELDALSLVMKGETIPATTTWRGIPARLVE
jgi:non-ribosomal peptide synthetase-like protein